ncbi:MAG: hypothetical protein ACD_59C00111G0001, partial [uncultured bacterium]
ITFNTGALYYEPKGNHRKNGIVCMRFEDFEHRLNYEWKLNDKPLTAHGVEDGFDIASNWIAGYDYIIYLLSDTTRKDNLVKNRYELCLCSINENKTGSRRLKLEIEELPSEYNFKDCRREIEYDFHLYLYYGRIYISTPYRIIDTGLNLNEYSDAVFLKCADKYSALKDTELGHTNKNYISSNIALTPYCFVFAVKNEESGLSRIIFLNSESSVKHEIVSVIVKKNIVKNDEPEYEFISKTKYVQQQKDYKLYEFEDLFVSLLHDGQNSFYFAVSSGPAANDSNSRILELKFDPKSNLKKIDSIAFMEIEGASGPELDFNVNSGRNCSNLALYQDKSSDRDHLLFAGGHKGYFVKHLSKKSKTDFKEFIFFKNDSGRELKNIPFINLYIGSGANYQGTICWSKSKEHPQSSIIQIAGVGNFKFNDSSAVKEISEIEGEVLTINFKNGESGCFFIGRKNSSEKILFYLMPGDHFFSEKSDIAAISSKIRHIIYLNDKIYLLSNLGLYCMEYKRNEDIAELLKNIGAFYKFCESKKIPQSEYIHIAEKMTRLIKGNNTSEEIKSAIEKIETDCYSVSCKVNEFNEKIQKSEVSEINTADIEPIMNLEKGLKEFIKAVPEKYKGKQE